MILGTTLNVLIGKNQTLILENIINNLNLKNTLVKIFDINGNEVTNTSSAIGTNYTLKTNNNTYKIVVKGDVNGDGKISALDYIAIRKHMIKSDLIIDLYKTNASDMNNDNTISALDYIAIRKIMIGG